MTELLVADVGGTGSRLACMKNGKLVTQPVVYANNKYDSFDAILDGYLSQLESCPQQLAVAVAGPVSDNRVTMTNLGWSLSASDLSSQHGIAQVQLINDFAALAWATLALDQTDLRQVGGGEAISNANRAILGPGTGLGVSSLIYTGTDWTVAAGEGGHVSLPALTTEEHQLITSATRDFGHCSAERLLSGAGLAYIYAARTGTSLMPERITELALTGDATALRAVEIFSELLGTVASNLALTIGARGGVYLAGGILPAIADLFAASAFRQRFEAKGRFAAYLQPIPVYLITATYPTFIGLHGYMNN